MLQLAGWVDGEWMVTGGTDGTLGGWLASTEVWSEGQWKAGENLPVPVQGHCMVQLNYSHVI